MHACLWVAGVARRSSSRNSKPKHGGADVAHVRRGAASNLYPYASRQLPTFRQLPVIQVAGATTPTPTATAAGGERRTNSASGAGPRREGLALSLRIRKTAA